MANYSFSKCLSINSGITIEGNTVQFCMSLTKKFSVWQSLDLGRSLVSTQAFHVGDLVLHEDPFVQFSSSINLIEKLKSMSISDKSILFDFHHFNSLDEVRYDSCRVLMDGLWERSEDLYSILKTSRNAHNEEDVKTNYKNEIFKCLTIANLNAHSFHPTKENPDNAALFPVAAKINHSCLPNTIYSITDTSVEYYAIEFIPKGTMITASYLDHTTLCQSTQNRRLRLMQSKDFFCLCTRCCDFDYSVPMSCQDCKISMSTATTTNSCSSRNSCGIQYLKRNSQSVPGKWLCQECGSSKHPNLRIAKDIENDYKRLEEDCDDVYDYIENLEILLLLAEKDLYRSHHLVTEIRIELCTVKLAIAHFYEDSTKLEDIEKSLKYRWSSTEILIELIKVLECINAKCRSIGDDDVGGGGCFLQHPPAPQCATRVYRACCSMIKCGKTLPSWVHAYLPLIRTFYGDDDLTVSMMKSMSKMVK